MGRGDRGSEQADPEVQDRRIQRGRRPTTGGASGAALRAYMLGLVNSNRLAAAFSKIGPPPPSGRSHKQWAARVATMATEDCLDTIGDADTGRLFRDQLYCKALGIINNEAPN